MTAYYTIQMLTKKLLATEAELALSKKVQREHKELYEEWNRRDVLYIKKLKEEIKQLKQKQ